MPTGNWPFINSFNLICILTGWFRTGDSLNGYIRVHSVAIDSNDDNNRIPIKDLIDKIIIHPQWNRTTRNSDIALIRLKKDVPYESKYEFSILKTNLQTVNLTIISCIKIPLNLFACRIRLTLNILATMSHSLDGEQSKVLFCWLIDEIGTF